WPFSTLGWPEDAADLRKFYPTQVMETGHDILFFWVARMMMMGIYFVDETPFEDVYLHAMVRDSNGNTMSKTKGNVIDPLHMIDGADPEEMDPDTHAELIDQFPDGVDPQGADALRFTLASYAAQGRDIKLNIDRIEGYRAFLNKLWNAARFAGMNLEDWQSPGYDALTEHWVEGGAERPFDEDALSIADKWILSRLDQTAETAEAALEDFRFDEAAQTLYDFVWHEFCDWYIELAKDVLYEADEEAPERRAAQSVLALTLESSLRLLHPIVPYVTEEIWQELPLGDGAPDSIMVAPWPEPRPSVDYPDAVEAMETVIGVIEEIRSIRGETDVKPGTTIDTVYAAADSEGSRAALDAGRDYIRDLASVDELVVESPDDAEEIEGAATAVYEDVDVRIPLRGMIDLDEEYERLQKELDRVEEDLDYVRGKLDDEGFVENAPEAIVQQERDKLDAYLEEKEKLEESVAELEQLRD
ncbi:MAG: class I tRNA ligase family protein, partial [Bradymonadaceae bacterium]